MKIEKYITSLRSLLLKKQLLVHILLLGIFGSIIFIGLIFLESIFYFAPKTKLSILGFLAIAKLFFITFWLIYHQRSIKNKIYRYKTISLSKALGEKLYPDRTDTILNALQLESSTNENESDSLANSYIKTIRQKLKRLDLSLLIDRKNIFNLKKYLIVTWVLVILLLSWNYSTFADAFNRLSSPRLNFPAPKPFDLFSLSGNIHILGGDESEIKIKASPIISDTIYLYLTPCQASTKKRDSLTLQFSGLPDASGEHIFKLPKLFQDYSYQAMVQASHFWEAWENVSTPPETVFVTDRPAFETLIMTIVPPKYSKLKKYQQEGNVAVISNLRGSLVQVELTANKILESAFLDINSEILKMSSSFNKASGEFILMDEGELTINLVDKRGITNRDPISYSLEPLLDHNPSLTVFAPDPISELGDNQIVPINLKIMDDYGFKDLQLAYEIIKPAYLQNDPYVSMLSINDISLDSISQTIQFPWELGNMLLMPEDEIHFHFELTDNDEISGPKKTKSNSFIVKVPSLSNLYEDLEESESSFIDEMVEGLNEIRQMKDEFETLELKIIKTKDLDWDQQQSMKNSLEQAKKEIKNLEKIAEAIEAITDQAEKHNLLSPTLLEKFKELNDLINNVIPENMLNNVENFQMALDEMDLNSIQDALSNLSDNMEQIEEDLDRYLEIFKRFQAEQKLDEIQNRMQQLIDQQNLTNQEIANLDKNTDLSDLEKLSQDEERAIEEFDKVMESVKEASELVKPFSIESSSELTQLANSQLAEEINESIKETMQSLSQKNIDSAQQSSESSLQNMELIMKMMMDAQQNFQQQTIAEMSEQFQKIMNDLLYLSSQEEYLRSEVKQTQRNSPRLRELAQRQQLLQDQLQSVTKQMLELSKETFAMTPEIGKSIGKANASMQEAKSKLTDRNVMKAWKNQDLAIEGLNEAALNLFNNMENMQNSGSASGFQQFLQMMQQMAGQQQSVNQQGMQLGLGQMAAAAQQQIMQQMLKNQKGIQKSLQQLMNEMRHSSQKGTGSLKGIAEDMDNVIKDLQNKRFTQRTKDRQKRILSRMLDSQTSMTQRGEKEERKSSTPSSKLVYQGPGGLPLDLGQREDIVLEALNNAMNAGYSKEHQGIIKRYFNLLSKDAKKSDINIKN